MLPVSSAVAGSAGDAAGPGAMPNWKPLVGSRARRLTPICFSSDRLTSAIRTLRLTCSGVAVLSRLTGMILQRLAFT